MVTFGYFFPVGPKLKAFDKHMHILKGDTIVITCVVTAGDSPITFQWTKDGHPTHSLLGVDILQGNLYSSLLAISNVGRDHEGEYSCSAMNAVGVTSTTLQLKVDGNLHLLLKFPILHS